MPLELSCHQGEKNRAAAAGPWLPFGLTHLQALEEVIVHVLYDAPTHRHRVGLRSGVDQIRIWIYNQLIPCDGYPAAVTRGECSGPLGLT